MIQFQIQFKTILGNETVSCCQLQSMPKMDMDWNLTKLEQLFQVLMLCLQKSPKFGSLLFPYPPTTPLSQHFAISEK